LASNQSKPEVFEAMSAAVLDGAAIRRRRQDESHVALDATSPADNGGLIPNERNVRSSTLFSPVVSENRGITIKSISELLKWVEEPSLLKSLQHSVCHFQSR
jgi:hypothetical protein